MAKSVFLYLPNIIGYIRTVAAFLSFYYMPFDHWSASFWFFFCALLDEFDGYAARTFGQCSRFGELFDQLIDRCSTMCFMSGLCYFYPQYMLFFQFDMALDISSHWFHCQSMLMIGKDSHKDIGPSANPILRLYYSNKRLLTAFDLSNTTFYCMLYLTHFTEGPTVGVGSFSLGLWQIILFLSAPLSFLKSGISVIQLVAASQNVAAIDIADREAARKNQ